MCTYLQREALPSDVEDIARLEEELFPDNWMSASSILNEMSRGMGIVVQKEGGPIVGYALVSYSHGVADILRLGLTATEQCVGLGSGLLTTTMQQFPKSKYMLTVRKDNERAIRLYKKAGFKLHGELENAFVLLRV